MAFVLKSMQDIPSSLEFLTNSNVVCVIRCNVKINKYLQIMIISRFVGNVIFFDLTILFAYIYVKKCVDICSFIKTIRLSPF